MTRLLAGRIWKGASKQILHASNSKVSAQIVRASSVLRERLQTLRARWDWHSCRHKNTHKNCGWRGIDINRERSRGTDAKTSLFALVRRVGKCRRCTSRVGEFMPRRSFFGTPVSPKNKKRRKKIYIYILFSLQRFSERHAALP